MSETKPFRLLMRLKNNRMARDREAMGITITDMTRRFSAWLGLENMRDSPLASDGWWRPSAIKIAEFLGRDPAYLWPEDARCVARRIEVELSVDEVKALGDGMSELCASELHGNMAKAVASLPDRCRGVLEMRFGLDGGDGMTLEEIAKQQGVNRERIRQIEAKALRMLRHPERSVRLKGHAKL